MRLNCKIELWNDLHVYESTENFNPLIFDTVLRRAAAQRIHWFSIRELAAKY